MNQTYSEIEAIIVNDGSVDSSNEVIQEFLLENENIIYIKQENQGVSIARNNGVKKATGKYLLFVDGDDYIDENYVEALVKGAENHQADLTICGYKMVNDSGRVLNEVKPEPSQKLGAEIWIYRICAVCSRMYRRDMWEKYTVQFESEEYARGEDTLVSFFCNTVAKNIAVVSGTGYNYVQYNESAMGQYRGFEQFHFPFLTMESTLKKALKEMAPYKFEYLQYGVYKLFAQFVFGLARGAKREKVEELCKYIQYINSNYFSEKNGAMKRFMRGKRDIPIVQKIAITLLMFLSERKHFSSAIYRITRF